MPCIYYFHFSLLSLLILVNAQQILFPPQNSHWHMFLIVLLHVNYPTRMRLYLWDLSLANNIILSHE